jgi:hypothetical protein
MVTEINFEFLLLMAILTCIGTYATARANTADEQKAWVALASWYKVVMWILIAVLVVTGLHKGWDLYFGE